MKKVYRTLFLCLFSTYVLGARNLVDAVELQEALSILAKYAGGHSAVRFWSVGSDKMNREVCAIKDNLMDMVRMLDEEGATIGVWSQVDAKLKEDSRWYVPTSQILAKAMLENAKLTSPQRLVSGWELYSALSHFRQVCYAIENMQEFSCHCAKNPILRGVLSTFDEDATEHMLVITQQATVDYLIDYIRKNKDNPEVLNKIMGSHAGERLKGVPRNIVDIIYDVSDALDVKYMPENMEFKKFIQEIREMKRDRLREQFWAYDQADKLLPGIVFFWCEAGHKEALVADEALNTFDEPLRELSSGRFSRFKGGAPIQEKGISWEKALSVMENLTEVYIKENDVHQDEVIQFLAQDAAEGLAKVHSDAFAAEQFPRLLGIMERFERLDLTKRKLSLLVCSAPHLSHRMALNPKIQELLQGTILNFLAPDFLCAETSQILKELHLLEMRGVCCGQVCAIAAYIKGIDSKRLSVNWNQVVYDVVLGLKSSEQVVSFLIKMKAILQKTCSNHSGFWTRALEGGELKEFQKNAVARHVSVKS